MSASLVWYAIGALLIAAVLFDAFLSMLAMRGGGPITNLWTRALWRAALSVHKRRSMHAVLAYAGPTMTVGAILLWYIVLLAGWFCIFAGHTSAVVVNNTGEPTTLAQRLYFTGTTVSTVGYGDLVPSELPWTLLTTAAAFTASFLITTSLSYLMPVISAAMERKRLANAINLVGGDPAEIIRHSWGADGGSLDDYWLNVFADINRHAQQHLVYPVLNFFHSADEGHSTARAVLMLSDSLFLISQAASQKDRPSPGFLSLARGAFETFAEIKDLRIQSLRPDEEHTGAALSPDTLAALGIEPVDTAAFSKAFEDYRPLRRRLTGLCVQDGW